MIRIRARLFAMQREIAGTNRLELELPDGADIEAAWDALVERFPALAPGRASVRFARNAEYAEPTTALADGDELAFIPPVSGGSGETDRGAAGGSGEAEPGSASGAPGAGADATTRIDATTRVDAPGRSDATTRIDASTRIDAPDRLDATTRIIELREAPFGPELMAELAARLATDEDGAIVAFVGRTRVTPGTPSPGQEAEAARHAGRRVDALDYEAHETMALRVLGTIADEMAERFGVERLAVVHRTGPVALGEVSIVVVAVAPHRDAAFAAARYAIDETKARVPIWKAERFADGHVWIGEPPRPGPAGD